MAGTPVWTAISTYVLVAIVQKELKLDLSLNEILQILSITLFEKTQLYEALSTTSPPNPSRKPLTLFDG